MLDDSCSYFLANLLDLRPDEEARRAVKWLRGEASPYLGAEYSGGFPNEKARTLVELGDTLLVNWDGDARVAEIAYLRLIRLARSILEQGSFFPQTPETQEAKPWLGVALEYILRWEMTRITMAQRTLREWRQTWEGCRARNVCCHY